MTGGARELTSAESTPALMGWIPFRIRANGARPSVDWVHLGGERFTAPFFSQTIERCLRTPFNQLFVQETPIETLLQRHDLHPGLRPTAFIFHGSRCGSTLLAQMAAAMPQTVVISEAPPVDHILTADAPDDARVAWLRAVVSAFGQPRGDCDERAASADRHLLVKLDAWHALQVALVQRAFPGVPCVFLYREPAAVVASQLRMPGLHMVPGTLDPSMFELDLAGVLRLGREEYASRVLGVVYAAAADEAAAGHLQLMNYAELPERACSQVLEWCAPEDVSDARDRLRHVAQFDAKTPSLSFDSALSARPAPSALAVDMAARFVGPHYARLEAIRQEQVASKIAGVE